MSRDPQRLSHYLGHILEAIARDGVFLYLIYRMTSLCKDSAGRTGGVTGVTTGSVLIWAGARSSTPIPDPCPPETSPSEQVPALSFQTSHKVVPEG